MTAPGSAALWAIATAGSLTVHVAVGYTLFAMPMPEARKETTTEIRFATPEDGTATTLDSFSPTESVSPRHGLARASPPVASTVLPGSNSANVAPATFEEAPRAPATATALDALGPTALPRNTPDTTVANVADTAPPIAPVTPPPSEVGRSEATESVSAAAPETTTIEDLLEAMAVSAADVASPVAATTDAAEPAETAAAVVQEPASLNARPIAALDAGVAAQRAETTETLAAANDGHTPMPVTDAVPLPPSIAESTAAAASLEARDAAAPSAVDLDPADIGSAALIAVRPDTAPVASAARSTDAGVAAVAPARQAAPAAERQNAALAPQRLPGDVPVAARIAQDAGGSSLAPASRPTVVASRAADAEPTSRAIGAVVAPSVSAPRAVQGVTTPSAPVRIEPRQQQTALVPIPRIDAEEDGQQSTSGGGAVVRDFLRGREGDDCLLAVPAEDGETAVEAFAISNAAVAAMAADFEHQSRSTLATTVRPVLPGQCSALGFARALPQYPNYLLQVDVARPEIRSGDVLEGIVSGVTKDTLYLVAVDDEGNAKLVESDSGLRTDTYRFSEPVHLTADPVASVQLLVAVGSDGPLKSMPTRDGLPADRFFSQLTMEIINDNRSIAFGMGSFIVR